MSWARFRALANAAHIDGPTLKNTILPWLRTGAFVDGEVVNDRSMLTCNVLSHDAILTATAALFANSDPTPEEMAVLGIVELGSQVPHLRSEILGATSLGDSDAIATATELAKQYKIVNVLEGPGIKEPVIYSPLIWGDKIAKMGKALSQMPADRREVLTKLIEIVRTHQGTPYDGSVNWTTQHGHPDLVEFAIGVGLLDKTQIQGGNGTSRDFLTTPHIYGELAATQGRDVCDRVKLFLDSIRHGEHYGVWVTGRISDPSRLLTKLIDAGEIGPCTAIGRDYRLVEKAGIVTVRESKYKPGQYVMRPVQNDTIQLVRDIVVQRSTLEISARSASTTCDQNGFIPAENCRAQLGTPSQRVREAEQEMLRNLREM